MEEYEIDPEAIAAEPRDDGPVEEMADWQSVLPAGSGVAGSPVYVKTMEMNYPPGEEPPYLARPLEDHEAERAVELGWQPHHTLQDALILLSAHPEDAVAIPPNEGELLPATRSGGLIAGAMEQAANSGQGTLPNDRANQLREAAEGDPAGIPTGDRQQVAQGNNQRTDGRHDEEDSDATQVRGPNSSLEASTRSGTQGASEESSAALRGQENDEYGNEGRRGTPPMTPAERLAKIASDHKGSREWDVDTAKDNFGKGKDKCNQFVYDMAKEAGTPVPLINGIIHPYPPLARQWADPQFDIPGWKIVTDPQPGDVVAIAKDYGPNVPATGHSAIVTGPETSTYAYDHVVKQSRWPWDKSLEPRGIPVFRRYVGVGVPPNDDPEPTPFNAM